MRTAITNTTPALHSARAISLAAAILIGALSPTAGARELIDEHLVLEGDYGDEGYRLTRSSSLIVLPGGTGNPQYIHLTSGAGSWADIDGVRMVGATIDTPNSSGLIYGGRNTTISLRNSWIESTDGIAFRLGVEYVNDPEGEGAIGHIQNTTIKGVGRSVLLQRKAQAVFEGVTVIAEHNPDTPFNHAVQLMDAEATFHDSYIKGGNHGILISGEATGDGRSHGQLYLSNTVVESEVGAAILVDDFDVPARIDATIVIANGSQLNGANGKLIQAGYETYHEDPFQLNVTVDNSQLTGDLDFHDRVESDVTITNHGSVTGRMIGVDKLTLADNGAWNLVEDSTIADLTMAGGVVDIHGTAAGVRW